MLLRALEPTEGLDVMRARRGLDDVRLLAAGPGRLTQALGISGAHDGLDILAATVHARDRPTRAVEVVVVAARGNHARDGSALALLARRV